MERMKRMNWLFPLAVAVAAAGTASCVSDDWDDGYYGRPGPRYGRYDRYDDYDRPEPRRYRDYRDRDWRDRDDDRRDDRRSRAKAPKGFHPAGSFSAGSAVECGIPTSKKISKVRIVGTSGSVSVNTVVLREGGSKTPFAVSRRLGSGDTAEIDLGGARQATGLRISTGGKGTFDVFVR